MSSDPKPKMGFSVSVCLDSGESVEIVGAQLVEGSPLSDRAWEAVASLLGLVTPEQVREHEQQMREWEDVLRSRERGLEVLVARSSAETPGADATPERPAPAAVAPPVVDPASFSPKPPPPAEGCGDPKAGPSRLRAVSSAQPVEVARDEWQAQLVEIIESGLEAAATDGGTELTLSMETMCEMLLGVESGSVSTHVRQAIGYALRDAVASRPSWSVVRRSATQVERESGDTSSRYHIHQRQSGTRAKQRLHTPGVR